MSTNATTTETNKVQRASDDEAAKAKVNAQAKAQAQAEAEANAYFNTVSSMLAEGAKLGALARLHLAHLMGASTNKSGRPTEAAYTAFVASTASAKLSYEQRAELCRKANAAVPDMHKPVAVLTAKANQNTGAARFRINLPVAVDIAVSG